MIAPITKRGREVLKPAVLYGWSVEYDRRGNAKWDGDTTLPFRAHKTLDDLVRKGLLYRDTCNCVRATRAALGYTCRAPGCQRGAIYEEGDDGYDRQVGRCQECDGTGLTLVPNASFAMD